MSHMKHLKVSKNDLILFFYTGHGYHSDAEGETPWPSLNFAEWKGVALDDVIKICRKKNARLTLIFSNCCNAMLPDWVALPKLIKPKGKDIPDEKKLSKAICRFQGPDRHDKLSKRRI
jgi:hypothetical protein